MLSFFGMGGAEAYDRSERQLKGLCSPFRKGAGLLRAFRLTRALANDSLL